MNEYSQYVFIHFDFFLFRYCVVYVNLLKARTHSGSEETNILPKKKTDLKKKHRSYM